MSDPIKVGDLVAVVRSCCIGYLDGCSVFTVCSVHAAPNYVHPAKFICGACKTPMPKHELYASIEQGTYGAPLSWLKRIPPLDELERDQIVEELSNVR